MIIDTAHYRLATGTSDARRELRKVGVVFYDAGGNMVELDTADVWLFIQALQVAVHDQERYNQALDNAARK